MWVVRYWWLHDVPTPYLPSRFLALLSSHREAFIAYHRHEWREAGGEFHHRACLRLHPYQALTPASLRGSTILSALVFVERLGKIYCHNNHTIRHLCDTSQHCQLLTCQPIEVSFVGPDISASLDVYNAIVCFTGLFF